MRCEDDDGSDLEKADLIYQMISSKNLLSESEENCRYSMSDLTISRYQSLLPISRLVRRIVLELNLYY
jgi:hypothetical protein